MAIIRQLPAHERLARARRAANQLRDDLRQVPHLNKMNRIRALLQTLAHQDFPRLPELAIPRLPVQRPNILNVADLFGGGNAPVDPAEGLNVHQNNRDQKTMDAIFVLKAAQGAIDQRRINQAVNEFTAFINAQNGDIASANGGLRSLRVDHHCGLNISGQELTGRLWIYADTFQDPGGNAAFSQRERVNAKLAMVRALADSHRQGSCNQGTGQRMVVAVLQGRLPGVLLDDHAAAVTTPAAVRMFFNVARHQAIETRNELVAAANVFCQENPGVERLGFLAEINNYADQQGMD